MSKKNYYCLVAGLPDLFFNESKQGYSSLEFRNELKTQLSKTDLELVKLLYLPHDNENLLNLFFEEDEPFNLSGNYQKEFLENQILIPNEIPDYMVPFLNWAKNLETRELNLEIENKLQDLYYKYVVTTKNNFLREWFEFELGIKNILTAFNCKQFNYSPEKHLIQAGKNNSIYSLLINKRLKHEFFEEELPFADQVFRIAESDFSPEEKEKAIDKILWDYLDEQTFFHYFTVEKVLSYVIKLGIIERWLKLDAETGKALLNKLIEELKLSYTFPEEFSTVK
ncbi:MAG: DUF2764 family protein [Prolixibacteraceae bacterium]|jgi:hypothetical protein|nr:DUF2764 family protein [Prolixibacteraceae bacterium]MBT6006538.1 DUF2764 family protein [Prolixibacteraceae bacterium]MBT6764601.1 DUF2764 family protein [Prolixibacteraceae bacterium]MBT6999373.1 DUF2764 family protein [Prolixibacteraceae bacterium]MBT7394523.1 DUF2764 family protein [Prolixibacteraceae bacterium]